MDSISQTGFRFPVQGVAGPKAATTPTEPAVQRLVAARVNVDPMSGIRDLGANPGADRAATRFEMYRHPADKNTAATGVHAGRTLDVQA